MINSRRSLAATVGVLVGLALVAAGLSAQAASPLSGTWTLNLAKSKYDPPSGAPKSNVVVYQVTGNDIKGTADTVDAQGRKVHVEYTAKMDGKDYPYHRTVDGAADANQDAISWKKIDDHTYESTGKAKGQVLTTTRVVVSKDGKSRTNTATGKGPQGETVNNVVVFDRK
jgi:hypothetical protein